MDGNSDTEDRHSVGRKILSMTIENHENKARKWLMAPWKNKKIMTGVVCCMIGFGLVLTCIVLATIVAKHKSELNTVKSQVTELTKIFQRTNLTPRTCQDYGRTTGSGTFAIEPKRRYNMDLTFTARCDFANGYTYIDHDHPDFVSITPCNQEKCFVLPIAYGTSMENIKSLMDASEECFQEVQFECVHSKLTDFASWSDSNGKYHKYFSSNDTNKCTSMVTTTEIHADYGFRYEMTKPDDFCDCDYYKDETVHNDTVKINSKALLPLQTFYYGRMGSLPHRGAVKIGPLTCKGTSKTFPQTCKDHLNAGNPPGYYVVMINHRMTVAYCDTEKPHWDDDVGEEDKSHLFGRDDCSGMNYKILDHESRKFMSNGHNDGRNSGYKPEPHKHETDFCDKDAQEGNDWGGQEGWYRIVGDAGWKLKSSFADIISYRKQCSSSVSGYLLSGEHPTSTGQIVNGTVCFYKSVWDGCEDKMDIQIKHCGAYFLYYLKPVPDCSYRYCTE